MLNKIEISRELFASTIALLENFDIEDYPPETIQLYGYVLYTFNKKKADIDLRDNYAKFINAGDDPAGLKPFQISISCLASANRSEVSYE